jgi:hypothetical protein
MDAPTDPAKLRAALEHLEAVQARRRAERIEAGELITVPLSVVVTYESQLHDAVEQAKADKLAELHAAGEEREVRFDVMAVVTGVPKAGDDTGEPWKPISPPFFPRPSSGAPPTNEEEAVREEPQPPIIESYVQVQVRQCRDDDDAGEIAEGWFSIDDGVLTVTDANGKYVGSRAIAGEDARVVAKQLLREKKQPESEDFNRRLSYPNAGLA